MDLTLERYCAALEDQTARLAGTVADVAADAPVPTCPEWTVAELVEHIGQTQQFVASIVADRVSDPSQLSTSFSALPAEQDAWGAWLSEGVTRLVGAFAEAGIEAQVWNPSGDDRTGTQFWLRRVLAETIIHRADAAAAADTIYELDADLAAVVVTDHLAMMTSPGWAAMVPESAEALRGSGQTLHLHAAEGGDWIIERGPAGATWRPGGAGSDTAGATVTGPAATLLRVLTRRQPIPAALDDGLQVAGDPDLLTHWVEHTAHVAK